MVLHESYSLAPAARPLWKSPRIRSGQSPVARLSTLGRGGWGGDEEVLGRLRHSPADQHAFDRVVVGHEPRGLLDPGASQVVDLPRVEREQVAEALHGEMDQTALER